MKSKLQWLAAALVCIASTALMATQTTSPATTPQGSLPINDFTRPADISLLKISPDGNYVAALVPYQDDQKLGNLLAILDAQTGHVLKVINSGHHALISNYFWVNNNQLVGSVAVANGTLDTPVNTGELFVVDRSGLHGKELYGFRSSSWMSRENAVALFIGEQPVDDNHVLIETERFTVDRDGAQTDIDLIDTTNGSIHGIGIGPAYNALFLADHAGQVRVAVSSGDMTHITLWVRPNNNTAWVVLNDPGKSHISMKPLGFNRDNSKLYVEVSQQGKPDAIELIDPTDRSFTMLFQGQFADPGKLLPTADGKDYYAVISNDGVPAIHYFDENNTEAQLSKALAVNFPGQLAYFSSFSRDGKRAIITVASDRNPGDYYVFDLLTHHAQFLASAEPWIKANNMRPMQPITLTARDGVILHGFLTLPDEAKPHPLIVLPHGGPHEIFDSWHFDPEAQLFASRGYAVLQVNYRGSGGYGSQFQALGYHHWGLSMQDDITDATKWAVDQGYASTERICIYGASYGGYAAMEGVIREPDLYKCAISYAGPYDLRVQMDKSDTEKSSAGDAYLHLTLGNDPADLLSRSPLSGVDRIKANLLLIHGGSDPRVPYKNFQEFTSALDKIGKHYESLVEMREGHGFYLNEHKLDAYQKMLDFLDQNIGTEQTTSNTKLSAHAGP